jgi:hypothetical protein
MEGGSSSGNNMRKKQRRKGMFAGEWDDAATIAFVCLGQYDREHKPNPGEELHTFVKMLPYNKLK